MPRSIPELLSIAEDQRDQGWLTQSVQSAIELEFSTIPLYLSAYWSIQHPTPKDANSVSGLIINIAYEEMLHLGLACNMLSALGTTPDIVSAVPTYQRRGLPGGVKPHLYVTLAGLTMERIRKLFMEIEYPEGGPVTDVVEETATTTYPTIGAFYDAIQAAFTKLRPPLTAQKQLTYPAASPWLFPVQTPNDFLRAITTIKEQGEGTSTTPDAPDYGNELAHYYKFASIAHGAMYVQGTDQHWSYSGPPKVPFQSVYPVMEVPKGGYPNPPAEEHTFNQLFTDLVNTLQQAWEIGGTTGNQLLSTAVTEKMELLDNPASQLVQQNYCPTFEYQSTNSGAVKQ
ncbi:MAG: ferritin-like protein [Chloroflexi bacterium]|nr:ferritin-like protein [Chloroflexota bacterium]MBV9596905.1 ferritin-like protein [Chloroflexota bacterium]